MRKWGNGSSVSRVLINPAFYGLFLSLGKNFQKISKNNLQFNPFRVIDRTRQKMLLVSSQLKSKKEEFICEL